MNITIKTAGSAALKVFASDKFFYVVVGLFALASAWVATASLYPMAFDEAFHFGLIQIYSTHLSPYALEPTRDMAKYGLVAADLSYLFHYLTSMPYRVLELLPISEQVIIVLLRCMNIGLVVWALFLYRKLLGEIGVPKAISHAVLAFFALIPILPLLAGQINYDNLLLVVIAWCMIFAVRIDAHLRTKKGIPLQEFAWLVALVIIGSNVKYAFLPIGLMILAWVIIHIGYRYRAGLSRLAIDTKKAWKAIHISQKEAILAVMIVGVLLSGRYVANLFEYGQFIPRCEVVFDYDACQAYGPWARNERMHGELDESFSPKSLPEYIVIDWVPGMTKRLFFAISGPTNDYANSTPLVVPIVTYGILFFAGLVAFIARARDVLRTYPAFWLLGAVTGAYIVSLVAKLYGVYEYTGGAVAINGRYLLPFIPIIGALFGVSLYLALRRKLATHTAALLVGFLLLVAFTQGAGIGTYLLQGEPSWFWPGWGQQTHVLLQAVSEVMILGR